MVYEKAGRFFCRPFCFFLIDSRNISLRYIFLRKDSSRCVSSLHIFEFLALRFLDELCHEEYAEDGEE